MWEKSIELDPTADTYYNLGIAYNDQGKLTNAIQMWEKAIELNPDDADAYNNLGVAYYNNGDFDTSLIYFKKAAKLGHKGAQDWLKKKGSDW